MGKGISTLPERGNYSSTSFPTTRDEDEEMEEETTKEQNVTNSKSRIITIKPCSPINKDPRRRPLLQRRQHALNILKEMQEERKRMNDLVGDAGIRVYPTPSPAIKQEAEEN